MSYNRGVLEMREEELKRNRNNHYVPQFYLRLFKVKDLTLPSTCCSIYEYDKETAKIRKTSIEKVASLKGFYSEERENQLSQIENDVAPLFKEIGRKGIKQNLSEMERIIITNFLFAQYFRTPSDLVFRRKIKNFLSQELLAKKVQKRLLPSETKQINWRNTSEELEDLFKRAMVLMTYSILENETSIPFITSDQLLNLTNIQPLETYGFLSKGSFMITILSPKYALILSDPRYRIEKKRHLKIDKEIAKINYLVAERAYQFLYSNSSDFWVLDNKNDIKKIKEIALKIPKNIPSVGLGNVESLKRAVADNAYWRKRINFETKKMRKEGTLCQ